MQLKFDDVPNGLLALLVVPALGAPLMVKDSGFRFETAGVEGFRDIVCRVLSPRAQGSRHGSFSGISGFTRTNNYVFLQDKVKG